MAKQYSQEQLWKLFEKLPKELREAVFSEETANNIYDICTRNGIEDNRISEVARYTGRVLLGILPPEDFQKTIEEELELNKETAKIVAHEINCFIFAPIKENLVELYNTEEGIASETQTVLKKKSTLRTPLAKPETAPSTKEKPTSKPDIYRESIK